MKNTNLNLAKKLKNDEFYTLYSEVEQECQYYIEYFKNQWIYLPCDSEESNFWKYFVDNFKEFGLKQLTATHINFDGSSYRLDYDGNEITKTMLNGNGDFRSEECTTIKCACDMIITNPPFSLFKEFASWIQSKKFLVLGNANAATYKDIFPLIKENKVWLGHRQLWGGMKFIPRKDTKVKTIYVSKDNCIFLPMCCWYTNIGKSSHPFVELTKTYNPDEYPKYDNYDAINVSTYKDIPKDYDSPVGVPITFMTKYNPEQFEILDALNPILNGKYIYKRLIIKKKNPS